MLPACRPFRGGTQALCLALIFALAPALLARVGAQEGAPDANRPLSGTALSGRPLSVAWSELDASEAPAEYRYLASSFPRLLRDATLFADSRLLSPEELARIGERSREDELAAAQKALLDALAKRDTVSLQVRDPARRLQELRVAESLVAQARERFESLRNEAERPAAPDAPVLSVPPESMARSSAEALAPAGAARPLSPWQGAEGRLLAEARGIESSAAELGALCDAKGIDYLFYGSLKGAGAFLRLELALYSASLGDSVWRGVEYSAPDALDGLTELFLRPAARALLGRDYARLFVDLEPPDASMRAEDGGVLTRGQLFFEERLTRLALSAPGYDTELLPLRIEPGSDITLKVTLMKRERARFTIDSDSPGARVYLDGEYLGLVPLELEGFADTKVLRVIAPGKAELQIPMQGSPLSGRLTLPALEDIGLGYKARLGEAKDQFYGALGWFVVSLPVSVLSFGSFRMYYDAGLAAAPVITDPVAIDSLNTRYIVSQSLFWVSSAVSAGLAVNAALKLIRYIRAAN